MRIENQNTNFGAIRVKGIQSDTKQAQKLDLVTKRFGQTAQYGLNRMKNARNFIQTQKGSATQRELFSALKNSFMGDKTVRITTCSDKEAFNGVNRPYKDSWLMRWFL